jgi:ribonuclease-3
MNTFDQLSSNIPEIEAKIGYCFNDRERLMLAFVHRSYLNEHKEVHCHNERLEFLGDSILGAVVSSYLYKTLPNNAEGDLSHLRARLVDAGSCRAYVEKLQVEKYMLLGRGERMNDGRGRDSILSDLFEAIMGAIYLDGGIQAAEHFLFDNFSEEIQAILKTPLSNWKADLQDFCQKKFGSAPHYEVLESIGPDHSKVFNVAVYLNQMELGRGSGSTKKEAQQNAAAHALSMMNTSSDPKSNPKGA